MKNDQRQSNIPSEEKPVAGPLPVGSRRLTGLYNLAASWLRANGHSGDAGAEAPEDPQARHMHEVMTIAGQSLELLAPMPSNSDLQRALSLILDLGISVGRMAQLCDVADGLADTVEDEDPPDVSRPPKATKQIRASPP